MQDLLVKFAEAFPAMYNDMMSYTPYGKDGVYIFLKDGTTVKFKVLKDGISLEKE